MVVDHVTGPEGGQKEEDKRDQVGDDNGDTADAGEGSRVDFADMVRLIHQAPADCEVPAQRREDERHTEGRDGEYE